MFLSSVLGKERHGEGVEGPPSELDLFVQFVRAHPGKLYQGE